MITKRIKLSDAIDVTRDIISIKAMIRENKRERMSDMGKLLHGVNSDFVLRHALDAYDRSMMLTGCHSKAMLFAEGRARWARG